MTVEPIPSREEFYASPLAREAVNILYDVMVAGYNPEKNRTWTSWLNVPSVKHIAHGTVHMCNVHHYKDMEKLDADTGLPELWHAFTRAFFAVMADRREKREAMKSMQEYIPE